MLKAAEAVARGLGGTRPIAQTQYWTGQACLETGDLDGARAAFGAVFAVYRDDTGLAHGYAVHGLGDLALRTGAYSVAERSFAEATGLARDGADALLEGRVLLSTAALHQAQGQPDKQVMALEQAVAVFTGCGVVYLEAPALAALARVKAARGDSAGADAAWTRLESRYEAAGLPEEDRIYGRPDR